MSGNAKLCLGVLSVAVVLLCVFMFPKTKVDSKKQYTEYTANELYELGVKSFNDRKEAEAIDYFQQAIKKGHTTASFLLVKIYYQTNRYSEMIELYEKMADGSAKNEIKKVVAACCYKCASSESDSDKSFKLYAKAANIGSLPAAEFLAKLILHKNASDEQISEWGSIALVKERLEKLKERRDNLHSLARSKYSDKCWQESITAYSCLIEEFGKAELTTEDKYYIGDMYSGEKGGPANIAKARIWMKEAADEGHSTAKYYYNKYLK